MGSKDDFIGLLETRGSSVTYHRVGSTTLCPCVTPEGFRDPEWHIANSGQPVCNERGFLDTPTEIALKAIVQPSQTTRATRLSAEYLSEMFGEVQLGDHIGIFPESWQSQQLDFYDWSDSGDEWILYNGRYYMVVAANLISHPDDVDPRGHWEVGMRLVTTPLG